jgi:hypothetical protein
MVHALTGKRYSLHNSSCEASPSPKCLKITIGCCTVAAFVFFMAGIFSPPCDSSYAKTCTRAVLLSFAGLCVFLAIFATVVWQLNRPSLSSEKTLLLDTTQKA